MVAGRTELQPSVRRVLDRQRTGQASVVDHTCIERVNLSCLKSGARRLRSDGEQTFSSDLDPCWQTAANSTRGVTSGVDSISPTGVLRRAPKGPFHLRYG